LPRAHMRVLDAEQTAIASAQAGGLLRPSFRDIPVPTDFVALIDRQSPRDHLAELNMQFVGALRDAGLFVEVLEFDESPALCRFVRSGERIRLDNLAALFPESIVLLFCRAEQLLDPTRHKLPSSLASLRRLRRVFLFTPRFEGAPTFLERELEQRLGVTAMPTSPGSLRELKRLLLEFGVRSPPRLQSGTTSEALSALFDFLTERPGRWMQAVAPRNKDRDRLVMFLRAALGHDALRWLSAAAIYPELRWPLTLSLKAALADWSADRRDGVDGDLLAVAQLPWFRRGWMPDWARALLQEALRDEDRRRGRTAVLDVLGLTDRRQPRDRENVAIRVDERATSQGEALKVDTVMLEYLWPGLRKSRALFILPTAWLRRLSRRPIRRFAAAAITGILAAAGGSFAALAILPIDECDLLAASSDDHLRIGPGVHHKVLRLFYPEKARIACKNAVEREPGNGRFWYQYARSLSASDFVASHDAARKSADLGYPGGFNAVGFDYEYGEGIEKDRVEARAYYQRAVERGSLAALRNLGVMAEKDGNKKQAFEYFKDYVERGGSNTRGLALYYQEGQIVPPDIARHLELLELGARHNDGDPMGDLGYYFSTGTYVEQDRTRGAALQERSLGLYPNEVIAANVAYYYQTGAGVKRDFAKATYWYIFAAKLGNRRGFEGLYEMLADGTAKFKAGYGPPEGFDTGSLLRAAAEAGSADAQFRLAELVAREAEEGKRGIEEAIAWYRRAAASNHAGAKSALRKLGIKTE
jgi:TPR repeat protein